MKQFALLFIALGQMLTLKAGDPEQEPVAQIRTNLYIAESGKTPVLMDGTLTQYHSSYSNEMNGKDARKMSNFSENWGMLRGTTTYVIERRSKIKTTDTIFFKMWNMRVIHYQIEFDPVNLETSGLQAVLVDNFLKTSTPVSLHEKNRIGFDVNNDPASKASDRFRLIYTPKRYMAALPVTFVSADAELNSATALIKWQTENESELQNYDIEKSTDGKIFHRIGSVSPGNKPKNYYSWTDYQPSTYNFYRIQSIGINGEKSYSSVMQLKGSVEQGSISVFPNPVTTTYIQLKISGKESGSYDIRLMNAPGSTIFTKTIQYRGGNQLERLQLPYNTPRGVYRLEVKSANSREMINVVIAGS